MATTANHSYTSTETERIRILTTARRRDSSFKTMNGDDGTNRSKIAPVLANKALQCWRDVSATLPFSVSLPIGPHGSSLDFSMSLATALFLGLMNVGVERFLVTHLGFPQEDKMTKWTTGSAVGMFHSINVILGLTALFWTRRYNPSEKLSCAPHWWQESCHLVLQFLSGYMMYDFVAIYMAGPLEGSDLLFLAHHVVVILYANSTRIVGAGHFSVMMCTFLGEVTNPFHNLYYITQNLLALECCKNVAWIVTLDYVNTFIFCVSYVLVRTIIGFVVFPHMSYELLVHGRKNHIPLVLILVWIVLKWGVGLGSFPWVFECWGILQQGYFPTFASPSLLSETPEL